MKNKYRLLRDGEFILADDEILSDDCENWDAICGNMETVFTPDNFNPVRRIAPTEPDVLTADEIIKKVDNEHLKFNHTDLYSLAIAKKLIALSHKNGRLEMWKEIRDRFEAYDTTTEFGKWLKSIDRVISE